MGEEKKVHINMVLIGDADSGKSTTIGQLISELGGTDDGRAAIERFEEEAVEANKMQEFDVFKAELERGTTALWKFETNKYDFTVIDPHGHANFNPNVWVATFLADCAVLIIDSTTGDFDQGFYFGGQTYEHAIAAYMCGVEQIICCCNKMDATAPNYSKGRYEEIVKQVSFYLKEMGYNPDRISFIPMSASEGDNMTERSTNLDWYEGPTLLEALDNIDEPKRPLDMPKLRSARIDSPPLLLRKASGVK